MFIYCVWKSSILTRTMSTKFNFLVSGVMLSIYLLHLYLPYILLLVYIIISCTNAPSSTRYIACYILSIIAWFKPCGGAEPYKVCITSFLLIHFHFLLENDSWCIRRARPLISFTLCFSSVQNPFVSVSEPNGVLGPSYLFSGPSPNNFFCTSLLGFLIFLLGLLNHNKPVSCLQGMK